MTEEIVKILSIDTAAGEKSVKSVQKEIKALKSELLNLDETTDDYIAVLGALSNRMFELKDMNEIARMSAADLGEKLTTVNKVASGLMSGFGAVTGSLALFGAESETVEKTMIKLQATIAIVQGLQGMEGLNKSLKAASIQFRTAIVAVKSFTTSLNGLKGALIATGIGAFVVLIGSLIANWEKITQWWNNTTPEKTAQKAIDDLDASAKKLTTNFNAENINALNDYTAALYAAGGDATAAADALSKYNKTLRENNKLLADNKLQAAYDAEKVTYAAYVKKQNDETLAAFTQAKNAIIEAKKDVAKAENDIAVANQKDLAEKEKQKSEIYKKSAEKQKTETEKLFAEIKKIEDNVKYGDKNEAEISIIKLQDSYNQDVINLKTALNQKIISQQKYNTIIENLNTKFYNEIYNIQQVAAENTLKRQAENSNAIISNLDAKISEIEQKKDNLISKNDIEFEAKSNEKDPEIAYQNEVAYYNAIYTAEKEAIERKNELLIQQLNNEQITADAKKNIQQQLFDNSLRLSKSELANKKQQAAAEEQLEKKKQIAKKATLSTASAVFSSMSQLAGEGTAAAKIAGVAQATVDTYTSANAAYSAMAGIPFVGPALGIAAAAAAVASGIANVKSILSVKTDGSSTSSPSAASSAVSAPAINLSESLPMTYTRNVLTNSEIDNINSEKDTKVYVLENDITSTQKKVSVAENNATF